MRKFLRSETRCPARGVPEVQDVHAVRSLIEGVIKKIGRHRHLPNPSGEIMIPMPLRERAQADGATDQLLAQSCGSSRVVICDKLNDFAQIPQRGVRNQDLAAHFGIIANTSSSGRTRPASTSRKPRSSAASRSVGSGSLSDANSSAASIAFSSGVSCAIAVLISCSVLIPLQSDYAPAEAVQQRCLGSRQMLTIGE